MTEPKPKDTPTDTVATRGKYPDRREERQIMPQGAQSAEVERIEDFLFDNPDYNRQQLASRQVHELDSPVIEATRNDAMGLAQQLIGVVIASQQEVFGIVRVLSFPTRDERIAVTRLVPGRAELIGIVDEDEPLVVGTGLQDGMSNEVSKEHFVVAANKQTRSIGADIQREQLVAGISDLGSTNGTELITMKSQETIEDYGLGDLIGAPVSGPYGTERGPLVPGVRWSVRSAEMEQQLEASR